MKPPYFLPDDYVENPEPSYYLDDVPGVRGITFQPDVYPYAEALAELGGLSAIVDLGCGYAEKLAALHEHHPDWNYIGIDHGQNLDYCRDTYTWGIWIDHDLEEFLPMFFDNAVLVCADVVEHLRDPASLLRSIAASATPAAVFSTPDRVREHGPAHRGPPPNLCHVREWAVHEFANMLNLYGLRVAEASTTRGNDRGDAENTMLVVAVPR